MGCPSRITFLHLLEVENTARNQRDSHHSLVSSKCDGGGSWTPNLVWREKVAQWCYDVVDHLKEDRSNVYVAMNILDRYCASVAAASKDHNSVGPPAITMNEKHYEVASLSAIFLAVRVAGSGELLLQELLSMSRGRITMQDIVTTGTSMVNKLSWDYRIITPSDFVENFSRLIPSLSGECPAVKRVVMDAASYLIEIAVCDIFLSHAKPSELALAALLNTVQANLRCELGAFMKNVQRATDVDVDSDGINAIRARLHAIYNRSSESERPCGPHIIEDEEEEEEELVPSTLPSPTSSTADLLCSHASPNKRRTDDVAAYDTICGGSSAHKRPRVDT